MRKLILCIALSLDGYIADSSGSVDFLFEAPRVEPDPQYKEFHDRVDTILFGSATYRQMVEEISPDKWMYPGKKCYVLSGSLTGETADVEFTSLSPAALLQQLRSRDGGDIWLFGGRKLIRSFMDENLVDEYFLYFMPVLLGDGVPLFTPGFARQNLRLLSHSKTDDIVKAYYKRETGEAGAR